MGYKTPPPWRAPEADDPRRCVWGKPKGRQCKRYKLTDHAKYCQYHARLGKQSHPNNLIRLGRMPRFYSKVLSLSLREALEADLALPPEMQFSLSEELALTRQVASQAIGLWAQLLESQPIPTDPNATDIDKTRTQQAEQMRRAAIELARAAMEQSLDRVRTFATDAARIFAGVKDKCNIHTIQTVLNQVTRTMYLACGNEPEGLRYAERFEQLIKENIRLPDLANGADGTTLTTDQTVTAMDLTVPAGPDPLPLDL
jgi:hypothetical protein